jgi:uncharacterized membrane protein
MSVTYALNGAGTVIAGVLMHVVGPRWVWGGGAATFALGAVAAFGLMRDAPLPTVEVGAT